MFKSTKMQNKEVSVSYIDKGELKSATGLFFGSDMSYIFVIVDGDVLKLPKFLVQDIHLVG